MRLQTIWTLAALSAVLFALACTQPAYATSCGTGGLTTWDAQAGVCRPNAAPPAPAPATTSQAAAGAAAGAEATATTGASTSGGGAATATNGGVSNTFSGGDSRLYVLPAPVAAAPLPAGLCQRSSSRAFALGWNFVSVGRSDSETDVECIERAFGAMPRPQAPVVLSDARSVQPAPSGQTVALQPAEALAAAPAQVPDKPKPKGKDKKSRHVQAADTPSRRVVPTCVHGEVLACAKLMEVW